MLLLFCYSLQFMWHILGHGLPFRSGRACSSPSWEFLYLELPCDFLVFFLSERLAKGSILSTNVVVDMVCPHAELFFRLNQTRTILFYSFLFSLFTRVANDSNVANTVTRHLSKKTHLSYAYQSCRRRQIDSFPFIIRLSDFLFIFYEWFPNINGH